MGKAETVANVMAIFGVVFGLSLFGILFWSHPDKGKAQPTAAAAPAPARPVDPPKPKTICDELREMSVTFAAMCLGKSTYENLSYTVDAQFPQMHALYPQVSATGMKMTAALACRFRPDGTLVTDAKRVQEDYDFCVAELAAGRMPRVLYFNPPEEKP